jgi:hypothetical protein
MHRDQNIPIMFEERPLEDPYRDIGIDWNIQQNFKYFSKQSDPYLFLRNSFETCSFINIDTWEETRVTTSEIS